MTGVQSNIITKIEGFDKEAIDNGTLRMPKVDEKRIIKDAKRAWARGEKYIMNGVKVETIDQIKMMFGHSRNREDVEVPQIVYFELEKDEQEDI